MKLQKKNEEGKSNLPNDYPMRSKGTKNKK